MYIYIRQISGIALGTKVLPYMRSTFLIQKMLSHGYRYYIEIIYFSSEQKVK